MPDRIDIDALLIGALYGELTPADEALLTAHLESHPADRAALADLTRTRAAVRDSRLLAVQLDPPQAISALLLQEASRRAPRPNARGRETASWFQRFVRSFMAHPAMAAAAMLVLVIGVAGTFYLRGIRQFAESAPPELPPQASLAQSAPPPKPEVATATPPTGAAAPAVPAAPVPESEVAQAGDRIAAGSSGSTGAVTRSDGYRVDLDDVARNQPATAKQGDLSAGTSGGKTKAVKVAGRARDLEAPKYAAGPPAEPAEPAVPRDDKPSRPSKKLAGIVVRTPELSPRELKEGADSDDEAPDRTRRPSSDSARDVAAATGRVTRGARPDAPGGGGAPPAPAAVAPAPAPVPTLSAPDEAGAPARPAFEPGAVAKKAAASEAKSDAKIDAKNETKKPVAKPAPMMPRQSAPAAAPPPPPANDSDRFAGKSAGPAAKDTAGPDKSVDKSVIGWARKRHELVKTLVSSNNCRAAASTATEIYSRAPDYYAANVVTDRAIKPCLPYLNNEREREDRVRAAKNAAASDSAAPAPPPVRK